MHTILWQSSRTALAWLVSLAACIALIGAPLTAAQAPAASGEAAPAPSPEELDKLVGPIALYPDDLVALILPASTNPLQIVQVDRFLDKRKQNPKLELDPNWDEAIKNLANYPDVIKKMSTDLDWTSDLGEAVVADQGAVMSAIQAFRRKAQSAGNLKTDDKQKVEVEKEIIKIVPADPQVIYVPQYNPSTVVVYSSAPVYGYYPAPYPSYYYPYPPGAALATGLIWGAAIGAAWGGAWGCGWGNNEININRNTNINTGDINRGDRGQGNRGQGQGNRGQSSAWKSDKRPGQVKSGAGRPTQTSARVGDTRGGAGGLGGGAGGAGGGIGGGGARPSTQPGGGGLGQGGGGRNQPGAVSTGGAATRQGGAGGGGRDAFGGYGSGSAARADSSRGASSRSSMSGGGYGGGGARAGGGGYSGGARGGGGGGGRGGGGGGRGGGGRR